MTSRDDRDRRRFRRRRPLGWAAALVVAVLGSSCAVEFHLGDKYDSQVGATATEAAADGTLTPAVAVSGTPLIVEDFDGTTLDADVWNTCHWWDDGGCTIATNDELEWYLPGQVRVRDGTLVLTAEKRTTVGADGTAFPYRSGMVSTGPPEWNAEPKVAFTYGAVEVRFRAPLGAGAWPAIWMLPASQESRPEIDLFEAVGQRPRRVGMYFHPGDDSDRRTSFTHFHLPEGEDLSDTHTVRLHWSRELLEFVFDGEKVWEVTGEQVPDEPMYLVINLAVGGSYGGTPDPSAFPATFEIDHVRIWSEGAL